MSKFTTEVRFICETAAGETESKGFNTLEEILTQAAPHVFDFNFPIFDESYRLVLEKKILRHYYTREIGEETVGLWKLRMNTRLNEIMPYYNKLYESELLEFNPFYDTDYTRTGKRDKTGTDSVTDEATKTGTIADDGRSSGLDAMNGTVDDAGSNSLDRKDNRVATDDSRGRNEKTSTGTIGDSGVTTDNRKRGGTETRAVGGDVTKETELDTTKASGGSDTVTENNDTKNDHWDYYSDTPQGTIGNVPGSGGQAIATQAYLTNVRHITDDTDGSEKTTTTDYGLVVSDSGSTKETTTHDTTDTLTVDTNEDNVGTNENTRTLDTKDTTTDENNSVKTDNGNLTETGSDSNTRTYNTTNTKDVENSNTRTFNTTDASQKNAVSTNLDEYTERVFGKRNTMSYAKLLKEFRETFLNIDMLVINQLGDLFMGLWE